MFRKVATAHLMLRLAPLNRALQAAVEERTRISAQLQHPDARGLCVTADQVSQLLRQVGAPARAGSLRAFELDESERQRELALRYRVRERGRILPLDHLQAGLGLDPFDMEAMLLCLAPEMNRSYERIYAYILDDLNRTTPCAELLSTLTTTDSALRLARLNALGPSGRLRRLSLLHAVGTPIGPGRQELVVDNCLVSFLLEGGADPRCHFVDRARVTVSSNCHLPPNGDPAYHQRLCASLHAGEPLVVGFWGPYQAGGADHVRALAADANRPLYRLLPPSSGSTFDQACHHLREQLAAAEANRALLWLDTDRLGQDEAGHEDLMAEYLGMARVPLCLTGTHPWRPTVLLDGRVYTETTLRAPGYRDRREMWMRVLGSEAAPHAASLAARYRLSFREMGVVGQLAGTAQRLPLNGHDLPVGDLLDNACLQVSRRRSARFATTVIPRRGPEDLVLPESLFNQVMEVARFHRVAAQVDEDWGFGRLRSARGTSVLFTGNSGTGKTLAAEVIAGQLKLPMLKVDLARVVSKWVGETEKHLEAVFNEASDCNAVLFFDEADSLFGKRGEIQQGTDRYANLEVGYLLQRLEEHDGLVILASNLKEQIDSAFIRRFQTVIHFPRPGKKERARIWKLALPESAPLDDDIHWPTLENLDLTGAGITAATRTAALLAADAGSPTIGMSQVIQGVARQYHREDRVLTKMELGGHAHLMRGD